MVLDAGGGVRVCVQLYQVCGWWRTVHVLYSWLVGWQRQVGEATECCVSVSVSSGDAVSVWGVGQTGTGAGGQGEAGVIASIVGMGGEWMRAMEPKGLCVT